MEPLQFLKMMPSYYKKSNVIKEITGAFAREFSSFYKKIQSAQNDFFVLLTSDSIERREDEYALKPAPTLPIDERRSRVLARMKWEGVVNAEGIKRIVSSYNNGKVDVIDKPRESVIDIVFVSALGVPANINDINKVLEDMVPAHIAINYVYVYISWAEFDNYNKTWNGWDAMNLSWEEFELYKEGV